MAILRLVGVPADFDVLSGIPGAVVPELQEADFRALIDAGAQIGSYYAPFAAWLEMRDDWRAAGYRWMAENGKRPLIILGDRTKQVAPHWTWTVAESAKDYMYRKTLPGCSQRYTEVLPPEFTPLLLHAHTVDRHVFFTSAQAAEETVCKLVATTPPKKRSWA